MVGGVGAMVTGGPDATTGRVVTGAGSAITGSEGPETDPTSAVDTPPPDLGTTIVVGSGAPGAIGVAPMVVAGAATATVGRVESSATFDALRLPTGFWLPEFRMPTFAATAPLAAVTMMAVAPAKVRATRLFMGPTVGIARPAPPPRTVKRWQSPPAEGPIGTAMGRRRVNLRDMNVLIVEDDDAIAEPLAKGLERLGFDTHRESTGLGGVGALPSHGPFDIVLLDLGLPDIDGYEVCRRIRLDSDIPIIVLTARGDEIDRVLGLELGADDYMVKPFGFRELVARINAVSRRLGPRESSTPGSIHLDGEVDIDPRTRRVTVHGDEVALTRKEFDLLALLATDPGATQTREAILEQVWDAHWYGPTKTLDVHVASLRKKLGDPGLIETVRGVGFRLRTR